MKKWIGNLLLLLLVLAGIGLMAYPGISDYYNSSRQSKAILAHDDKISRLDPMTKLRILGAADAYNDALRGEDNRFQTALEENAEKYAQCLDRRRIDGLYRNTLGKHKTSDIPWN